LEAERCPVPFHIGVLLAQRRRRLLAELELRNHQANPEEQVCERTADLVRTHAFDKLLATTGTALGEASHG
jgi:C4-dicarboxylate-specific signal transduction histidine kinase